MSYGRNPHYIWSDGDELHFEPYASVPEYLINAFLYKVLLMNRRDELANRLQQGKQEWLNKEEFDRENLELNTVPQDEEVIQWMNDQEDDILKKLMYG
jgi:hypothetical protein